MNQPSLFRPEVEARQANRLQGSVNLATPVAWHLLGLLLFATVALTIVVLTFGSFARVATVTGTITLDTGVASVVASRNGTIAAIGVREGETVVAGRPLVWVRAEEALTGGVSAPARVRDALRRQDEQLLAQGRQTSRAAAADRARIEAQIDGIEAELGQLARQRVDQLRLIEAAQADVDRTRAIADRGYVSRRDFDARETLLVTRRQQLAQFDQLMAAKRAGIVEARRTLVQTAATAGVQVAGTEASRAALNQQLAEADLASGYVVTSPVAGEVTALTARPGQPVAAARQLMMIIPDGSRLCAELQVPTSAAAFIRPGQEVSLAVDAFPYATFGTMKARVMTISGAAVARPSGNGEAAFYTVTAALSAPSVRAFGRNWRLLPGMTLTGRIITERRSLLRWLFEPFFAVRNR